jgi:hypothetical protein
MLAAGCSDSPMASAGAVFRDSAGIAIVENRVPRWAGDSGWRVVPQPSLVIGGSASPDSEQFSGAIAATRLSDGRILVGDRTDWKVRVYDQTGRQVSSFGRRGQGPGESRISPGSSAPPATASPSPTPCAAS